MKLATWPITHASTADVTYDGGQPDSYLWTILGGIGDRLMRHTNGSNLVPEILDPFGFAQFVTELQRKYTVNGMPFAGKWRLLPCARRMTERLGANTLAKALRDSQDELTTWDPAVLDRHDRGLLVHTDPKDRAIVDTLVERFDKRFQPMVEAGECSHGTLKVHPQNAESDRIRVALAEWVSAEISRDVLPQDSAVSAKFAANDDWSCDHVACYEKEITAFYAGADVNAMLKSLGLCGNDRRQFLQVIVRPIATTGRQYFVVFRFGGGKLLAHRDTSRPPLERPSQHPSLRPSHHPSHRPPLARLVDALAVVFDPATSETRIDRAARNFGKPLIYAT